MAKSQMLNILCAAFLLVGNLKRDTLPPLTSLVASVSVAVCQRLRLLFQASETKSIVGAMHLCRSSMGKSFLLLTCSAHNEAFDKQ